MSSRENASQGNSRQGNNNQVLLNKERGSLQETLTMRPARRISYNAATTDNDTLRGKARGESTITYVRFATLKIRQTMITVHHNFHCKANKLPLRTHLCGCQVSVKCWQYYVAKATVVTHSHPSLRHCSRRTCFSDLYTTSGKASTLLWRLQFQHVSFIV